MSDYDHLLVTTDFSDAALAGVQEAGRLARRLGARLTLLYAVEDRLPPMVLAASDLSRDQLLNRHRKSAEDSLRSYAAEHLPGLEVDCRVRVGRPPEEVVEAARELKADLIVLSTHGYGFLGQVLFGSTAERILHHAPCPVVVVRSGEG